MTSATRYRVVFFLLALLVLIALPARPVGVADGLPADHPLDLWIVLVLVGGFFVLPWRIERHRAPRLALALLAVAIVKLALATTSLPHGLAARYYANAAFEGPPEASLEYRLPGATRLDPTIAFAPVGFAWKAKPFPLWFFNDSRRYNFYRPDEPDRDHLPFSVRWDGFIRARTADPLAWRLVTEQEATLELFGHPIVSTKDGPPQATVALTPGWHPISLTYVYRGGGPKSLRFEWNDNGSFHPVPSSALLPFRPSPQADRWDGATAFPGLVLFALQFLVVGWVMAAGLWGLAKERLLGERTAVYALVVVMVAFGTISLGKRGRSPNWNVLNGGDDALHYESAARQILLERDILNRMGGNQPFYFMPGYRYFLAGAHAVLGESKAMVVMAQYILLAVACALLYGLVRCLAPPGPAFFAAALLFAGQAHGTVYRWATELFPTILGLAFTGALLLGLARWEKRPTIPRALGIGALGGIATIVRPNLLPFLPLAIIWMGLAPSVPRARRWQWATAALLTATLAIAPVTWRNWHVSGRFVLLVRSVPTMLYVGNTPPSSVDLSSIATNTFYERWNLHPQTRKVLEYFRQQPVNFIKGLGHKILQILGFAYPFAPALLLLHLAYLLGAVLLWRAGVARRLAILLHAFVLSQWLVLVVVKPGPHLPKTQLPTFLVAFGFAALLIVSWMTAAIGGRPPPSIVPGRRKWTPPMRVLGAVASLGLLAALTYTPRLPLLIPLLIWVAWRLRRSPTPRVLSP
jgi:hypothetical protein